MTSPWLQVMDSLEKRMTTMEIIYTYPSPPNGWHQELMIMKVKYSNGIHKLRRMDISPLDNSSPPDNSPLN